MFCDKCGAALVSDAAFCLNCGAASTAVVPQRAFANPSTRIKAFFLDKLFLFFLVVVAMAVTYRVSPVVAVFTGAMLPWLYYAGFESSATWQGTPGKALSGLKVVRMAGRPLSFARATLRYFIKAVSLAVWLGAIASLALIAYTDTQQALHDLAVDSQVVPK